MRAGPESFWQAVETFRERCLRQRRSLLLPDDAPESGQVWTSASALELERRFIDRPDTSSRSFLDKLRLQLQEISAPTLQLLVELTWFHVLIARKESLSGGAKRKLLEEIASIGAATVPTGPLADVLDDGICRTGTSFHTRRPNQLWLLIRFARRWLDAPTSDNERCLAEPWAFRQLVFDLPGEADQTQRHALLCLVHPDTFEETVSQYHKRATAKLAEPGEVGENDDETIAAIRTRLSKDLGDRFSFYDEPLYSRWSTAATLSPSAELLAPVHRAWLVRADGGKELPGWLERGECAISFVESFPFTVHEGESREELRARSSAAGIDTTASNYPSELGQVYRFVNSIQVGDYVVSLRDNRLYVGSVASPARSEGDGLERRLVRSVEWLNSASPRPRKVPEISSALYSKLRTLMTVSELTSVLPELQLA